MTDKKLFAEFPQVSAEQWIAQVVKDLKGKSFEETLTYTSADGIRVKPFYTKEDLEKYSERNPLFTHADWEVRVEIDGTNESEGNKKALHQLNNGATALLFFVRAGTNLTALLNRIGLEYINVQFVVEGNPVEFQKNLDGYLKEYYSDKNKPAITLNIDPLETLLQTGDWRRSEAEDREELAAVSSQHPEISINAAVYHNAGAPPAYEIACILAHANTYINWLEDKSHSFTLNVAVGPDYFFEIAKLRALRKVFALLLSEYAMNTEIVIYAETATRNLTVFDTHNNLLRTTTAAMAASIGGCNSLVVKPFDVVYDKGNEFSERLARNIQLILKEESYLNKVADVSAGSFFIEELTEQIAEKAWGYFTEIEKQGGLISALKAGNIQQQIRTFAEIQQQEFNEGKTVLVGTNKFRDAKENKQDKASSINWGNERIKGVVIETLDTTRLSAADEKERLSQYQNA